MIGKRDDAYAISSEDCAFPNLDFETVRDMGAGEILLAKQEGIETVKESNQKRQVCAFLWVYYGFPASSFEGINVEQVRCSCGEMLAQRDSVKVDCIGGVPDSGTAHGIGYANARGISYQRPMVKYTPTWPRSFMPQDQNMRDLIAKMKLIPIKGLIEGLRLLLCEDSIVRGTQLQDNVRIFFELGVKEVHMRPACPPLIFPCEFLNFSQSRTTLDLIGRQAIGKMVGEPSKNDLEVFADASSDEHQRMVELIREELGLTSLMYQRLEDLVAAIGLPKEDLCTHCWDGSSFFDVL